MFDILDMLFAECSMTRAEKVIAYICATTIGVFCGVLAYSLVGKTMWGMRYTVVAGVCDMLTSAAATAVILIMIRRIKLK